MLTEFSLPLVSGVEKAEAGQPGRDDLERVAWAAADSAGWAGMTLLQSQKIQGQPCTREQGIGGRAGFQAPG